LQRNQNSVEVRCEHADYFDIQAKLFEYGIAKIVTEHKRVAYHKPAVTFSFDIREKRDVSRLILLRIYGLWREKAPFKLPPDVVDADEDAEDIGVVVDAVGLPAVFEVAYGVSADAGVNDIEVMGRVGGEEVIGDEVDVTIAEGFVGAAVPVGVGNAVADEKKRLAGL